ncbi:uncharacterized protein TrAtP1_002754 [Trichoderma atroviride]|uniref:uncharacterized protein n=1 Tax=Hypocrea atroviridis TaxID=63577 RepID=UPI00331F237B|nr:hypothetical protein TrAtP1_002754 [Trichoderma atroviride]
MAVLDSGGSAIRAGSSGKPISLILLTVQNSAFILIMHYSRIMPPRRRPPILSLDRRLPPRSHQAGRFPDAMSVRGVQDAGAQHACDGAL